MKYLKVNSMLKIDWISYL